MTDKPQGSKFDQSLLDLADGELWGDERRSLLAQLDDKPNGWRQCALAFLQTQAWRQSLHSDGSDSHRLSLESPGEKPARKIRWRQPALMAASVVLAFIVGLGLGDWPSTAYRPATPKTDYPTVVKDKSPEKPSNPNNLTDEEPSIRIERVTVRMIPGSIVSHQDQSAVRPVHRQVIYQTRWFNKDKDVKIEHTKPTDEVVLVRVPIQ